MCSLNFTNILIILYCLQVLGKFHPHGDTAVYDSLVRMAQVLFNPFCYLFAVFWIKVLNSVRISTEWYGSNQDQYMIT